MVPNKRVKAIEMAEYVNDTDTGISVSLASAVVPIKRG